MPVSTLPSVPSSVRILALTAASALFLLMAVVVTAERAAAEPCLGGDGNGNLQYCNEIPGGDEPGGNGDSSETSGGGGGGGHGPSCDLTDVRTEWPGASHYFCEGENACWKNDPPATITEAEWPEPPSPEAGRYIFKYCEDPSGTVLFDDFMWTGVADAEPSLEQQAQTAFGELNAPEFVLAFSPPQEALIYIDTWWWAEGAPEGPLRGSSAFGLVAIAEPHHLEIDPGDGSGTITCEFVTTESDACTHVYEHASGDGGYPAQARLVYDVHFEENGAPIDIPGAPGTFESPWHETAVPVTEVQTSVIR